ncbi:MAG TPA: GAF domain-containing sensor histidine kinase [Actinomycetota bacterium]
MSTADQLRTVSDRNRMLIEAGVALASELDLEAVLQRIVELATEITGARYGALGVLGDDRRIARFLTVGISEEERAAIGDPPTGHGILGVLIDDARRPVRIDDLSHDPRSYGFPPHHPPMRSFLGAPVRALGRVFGNIYLTDKQGAAVFDEDDEEALVVLATQAGVAIENARLYAEMTHAQQELRRLEVLEERERIAKELHDGVIQALFAVGMGLQGAAATTMDRDLATRLENAVEDIDRTIRDLRNYIFGLRPGILADRQLDQALHELCRAFEEKTGILAVAEVDDDVAAELASVAADIVQIVREALSNIGRHANATTCRVSLKRHPDGGAVLEVDDDGDGFDIAAADTGMGLANLRDRVSAMGGRFDLRSVSGEGTTVVAHLPL